MILPNVSDDFAAKSSLAGSLVSHHALAGGDNSDPQATQYARQLVFLGVNPEAGFGDTFNAGITIATSIASAITQRKVRANTAMTGEITLRGKVLPVGGIKEKILAAKRAGIKHIVMCRENQKNVEEIPEKYLKGVDFHYVENVADVWQFALTDEKVKNPTDFSIEENDKKE